MKNFIKTLFAVILGNGIFYGIFFLLFFVMLIGLAMRTGGSQKTKVLSESILKLSITGSLSDMSENKDFSFGNDKDDNVSASIFDIINGIKIAKTDTKIKGIWIPLNFNEELSYAQIDLLRNALVDFKTSKKPIIAYGEIVSQKMYYLASLADKIYVNPNGGLDIRGFGAQLIFLKNALDRLEIQPQIFYAGKFKSATEPLRLDKMSEENKQQTRELLMDISQNVISNIAKDRNLSEDDIQNAINQLQVNTPHDALLSKFIDGEKYIDEVEDELKKNAKIEGKGRIEYTSIYDYISENEPKTKAGDIAVYVAEGDIIDGKSQEGSIGSASMVKDLRILADDDAVKAVVLRINSPGGSALASSVMLREIELLKKKKPVIVSMGNVAASGGYYIACSGQKIFAEPNTITGSIGVFGIIPNIGKMLNNKLGVTFDEVELNEHAVIGINKNFDPVESNKMQTEIDYIYQTFKSVVSKGRNLHIDTVESIAQGRVWSGKKAKSLHLIDEIGGLNDAIKYTASLAKVDENSYYFFNKRKSQFELFMENFSNNSMIQYFQNQWIKSSLGNYTPYFEMLKSYKSYQGAQARMIYQVKI